MKRNPYFSQLSPVYIFSEIKERVAQFQKAHPERRIISLGIGDTTEPLGPTIAESLVSAASDMKDPNLYMGYGPEQGLLLLREKIATTIYRNTISADEIFITDGTKGDISRLQALFGPSCHIAVLNPSYPAYADSSLLHRIKTPLTFSFLSCLPSKLPDLTHAPEGSVIFLCSPNNPTGDVYTQENLHSIVKTARLRKQIIVYDTSLSAYIRGNFPRSIFEVEGAHEVAIELGSFSKMAGFSGLRCGWVALPRSLSYDDGSSVHQDFSRLMATVFNGASIISQKGAIQALSEEGLKECAKNRAVYLGNTALLQNTFVKKNFCVCGGQHAPFLWVNIQPLRSFQAFEMYLQEAGIIVTPGVGFGPDGEGYIRVSGFGKLSDVQEATERIERM